MSSRKDNPSYGISRVDIPGKKTHGWQVRLQRQGWRYQKFFADGLHDGKENAFKAAQVMRDELVESLEGESRRERAERKTTRNSSGIVGVCRTHAVKGGKRYPCWQASWSPEPGKRKCVKFFVSVHGEKEAKKLAIAAREAGLAEMTD